MLFEDCKSTIYKLEGLPPGIFGETYAIAVGIHVRDDEYKGEYFVVSQRPNPNLYKGGFAFSASGVSKEYLTIDLDFLVQECCQQAEIHLIDRLQERADQLKRPDLVALPVKLTECKARPFIGCWFGGRFHREIKDIAQTTECQSLSRYLNAVVAMSPFTMPSK